MVTCSAIGCTNRSSNKEIRFYQVPTPETSPVIRQKWLHNIRRDGELPKHKSFYICFNAIYKLVAPFSSNFFSLVEVYLRSTM